jgi:hypothetical protein
VRAKYLPLVISEGAILVGLSLEVWGAKAKLCGGDAKELLELIEAGNRMTLHVPQHRLAHDVFQHL